MSIPSLGRALRHRDYRLYFVGQGLSLIGTWMTRVATSWLIYRLTGSAMLLGGLVCIAAGVGFFAWLPALRRLVRPSYARLGILLEIASGLRSAAQLSRPPTG